MFPEMAKEYAEQLTVIPFSTDKKKKEQYWANIGINCITGIYEPFGYTICEAIDRGVPVIVQNIDGPKEILEGFEQFVYMYDVDVDDYDQDITNFSKTLNKVWGYLLRYGNIMLAKSESHWINYVQKLLVKNGKN